MKKSLYILLISCFSLTIIFCDTIKEDSTSFYYSSPLFVAMGDNGTILTSSDGSTWTSRTSGTSEILYEVTCANSTFVVLGTTGTILTSSD